MEEGKFKLLDICHHFTAGMKAIATDMQYKGTDECRTACGGAGYHIASGLVTTFADHATMITFEGVNVLMLQQSSRYLFKKMKQAHKGKTLKGEFKYINDTAALLLEKNKAQTITEFQTLESLRMMLQVRAVYHQKSVAQKLANSTATTAAKHNDLFATDIAKMTKYHIIYIMFELTRKSLTEHSFKDTNCYKLVEILLKTFALNQLSQDYNALYETGYFTMGASDLLNESLKDVLI